MEAKLSPRQQLQVDYWGELQKLMKRRDCNVLPRKPQPLYWQGFSIGRTEFQLMANFNVDKNYISAGLMLTGGKRQSSFALLQQDKEEIERELGKTLYWHEPTPYWEKKTKYKYFTIDTFRESYDLPNRDTWPDLLEWHFDNLEALHRVFAPRIKTLP